MDKRVEKRIFTKEDLIKKSRVGPPLSLTFFDKGLSTIISKGNKDALGKDLDPNKKAEINRLRKWDNRTKTSSSKDRSLREAMTDLDRFTSLLNLKKEIKESTAYLYRKAIAKGVTRGRSIEGILLASIYISWRKNRIPKTLTDFERVTSINIKKISKFARVIQEKLHISLPVTSPIDLIPRFCSELELTGEVQSKAIFLLQCVIKSRIMVGKHPAGIAATALYAAALFANQHRSQRKIADIAGISEEVLRKNYKEILKIIPEFLTK